MKKISATWPTMHHAKVARFESGIIFKVWRTVTLQPFDLPRLIVSLKKDVNLTKNIKPDYKTRSNIRIGFAIWKWTYFHSTYDIGEACFSSLAVYEEFMICIWKAGGNKTCFWGIPALIRQVKFMLPSFIQVNLYLNIDRFFPYGNFKKKFLVTFMLKNS